MWVLVFCLSLLATARAISWNEVTANIAVVEFDPIRNETFSEEERVAANLAKYVAILEEVTSDTKLDMIIFPEGSLRVNYETAVEITVNDNPIHTETYPQYMRDLAEAANTYNTYLVTNIVEKVKCDNDNDSTNCKEKGYYYYNTDVVFNRNGTITNKYHKLNLFGEKNRDRAPTPEVVVFETDFGPKFGIFTCFDILFKNPAQDVLKEDIDAVIYPTNWHSELPFLTALQSQQMWAYTHNITLFAAGGNYPVESSGGSGVYEGSVDTVATNLVADGGSKVLIYKVQKGQITSVGEDSDKTTDELGEEMDAFPLWQDDSLEDYETIILNNTEAKIAETVCSDELCCNFNITRSNFESPSNNSYVYRLAAFSGVRKYAGIGDGGFEVCGIIACVNDSIASCGLRITPYQSIEWSQTFDQITITASFEINDNKTQFPNSLLSSIRPIDASDTEWSSEEVEVEGKKMVQRKFSTTTPQNRLLTFAIFGRNFAEDTLPTDDNNAGNSVVGMWMLLTLSMVALTVK